MVTNSRGLRRDMDLTTTKDKQAFTKPLFIWSVHEGTTWRSILMVLSLYRQNKFPGIGQMFRYTLRDESNHIEVFRNLTMDLIEENADVWTPEFKEDCEILCVSS